MLDVLYVVSTVLFFALMLAFVRGLAVLGRDAGTDASDKS
jgi:hypothetical protein